MSSSESNTRDSSNEREHGDALENIAGDEEMASDGEEVDQEPALIEENQLPHGEQEQENALDGDVQHDQEPPFYEENALDDDDNVHSWNTDDGQNLDQQLASDAEVDENVQNQPHEDGQAPEVFPPEYQAARNLPQRLRGKFTEEEKRKFALGYYYEGPDWDTISRAYVTTRNMDQLKYYFRKNEL